MIGGLHEEESKGKQQQYSGGSGATQGAINAPSPPRRRTENNNYENLQQPAGKLHSEREVGYRSNYSQRGSGRGSKFRGYSQVYQRKPFKDDPLTGVSQSKPIILESPPKGEEQKRELEIIHEDPSAVDESAILQHPLD
jgi:hypothetical protein